MFEYIVQPGDNLFSLSRIFGVSGIDILALNPGLLSNYVHPGITIKIPINQDIYVRYPWYINNPYLYIATYGNKS